jgi:cell division protein ZapB
MTNMSETSPLDPVLERVERLIVRYEELKRTNDLLVSQVDNLTQERDSLKSRLQAARSRIDGLLDRLPVEVKDTA